MGLLFHSLGILATSEVEVASAQDLVAQYVGQTAPKVSALFKKSVGKVLFIDEVRRQFKTTARNDRRQDCWEPQ